MKQKAALLLAFILLLNLIGCTKTEKDGRGFDSLRSFSRYYTQVRAAETVDTIYFLGWNDNYIKYVDKATKISGFLCGKPECRHNDADCNAYVDAYCLLMYNNRLYWVTMKFDPTPKYFVYSMALDGTDRREEAELPEGFISSSTNAYRHYILHDGWLYFGDVSKEIVDGEQTFHNYIAAFPFDSKKEPFVILEEKIQNGGYNNLSIQFYGGYLYILTNEGSTAHGDGEELYDCKLRRWETETGELETLYEDDKSKLNWTSELWVTNDGVIFNRNTAPTVDAPLENRIYKYEFNSGECEYLFDNGLRGWPNMGLIADNLITGYQITNNDDGIYDFYVVLKDFEGNVLVNDTYTLDIRDGYTNYGFGRSYGVSFLGRDEGHAYYSFYEPSDEGQTSYVSIISVALDGSGARVMCTQTESVAYGG